MRVVFLGSGPFGLPALDVLHARSQRFPLLAVVTRPDRPAGRGRKLHPTPVKRRATDLGIDCHSPESVNAPSVLEILGSLAVDVFVVADYGEMLGSRFLAIPSKGAFNLHGSLLPKYRGAAPVPHAILAGETVTGVSLFRIERALDSGPLVRQAELSIDPLESAGELEGRLARLAAKLLDETLDDLASGGFQETRQDHDQATLAPTLKKRNGLIHWNRAPGELHNFVRAMNPWPKAYSFLQRPGREPDRTAFLRVLPEAGTEPSAPPGTAVDVHRRGFSVACRGGSVRVLEIQRGGKAAMGVAAYLCGQRLQDGDRFGGPDD